MTTQLRDGTTASDPRLGRLKQFDPKSRAYPIRAALEAAGIRKPRSYTWRVDKWLNQLAEGSCVGHAWAHELIARPVRALNIDHDYARRIYHEAQKIDPWPGGAYEGGAPFYEGTSVLAGAQICQRWKHFDEYRWAFGLEDLILALGYAGPAVLGIDWYRDMAQTEPDGRIRPHGELLGGHAILAYRVELKSKREGSAARIWLWNSWGQEWGLNGTCYLTFEDMEKLLQAQGEACIPALRKLVSS